MQKMENCIDVIDGKFVNSILSIHSTYSLYYNIPMNWTNIVDGRFQYEIFNHKYISILLIFQNQVNELKEINLRMASEKTGLELRLSQQEQLILSLKSKVLEYEHPKKPCTSEEELNSLLVERGKELHLLHQELAKRDEIIENQNIEIESLSHDVVNKKRTEVKKWMLIHREFEL